MKQHLKLHRRHKLNYLAKRMVMIIALSLLMVSPPEIEMADAQVFIVSDDEFIYTDRVEVPDIGFVPVTPQDLEEDWIYSPVGDGLLLLAGLGVAYLISKRRRCNS